MPVPEPQLPVSLLLWAAALVPVLVLLVLLVVRRWTTSAAAPVALAAAVLVAVLLFRTPPFVLAVAAGKGIWDAIFILYVIWPSLVLYHVANEAGAFAAIQRGVRRLIPDRLLLVLAFSWVLASFIQSIAGFGTPLAVTTPLLVGLGMRPLYAVILPMIGAAWGNVFGSLGVPWLATLAVVRLDDPGGALVRAALLLWIPNLMAGVGIAWLYGRAWALRRGWLAIVAISLLHGGLQLLLVPLLPSLGNFLATAAALVATFGLSRLPLYRKLDPDEPKLIFTPAARTTYELRQAEREAAERSARSPDPLQTRTGARRLEEPAAPEPSLGLAFTPYAVLAVLVLVGLLVPPVRDVLARVQVGVPFPATATGFGVARPAAPSYSAFEPLTHPGTFLLLASVVGYALFRARGFYPAGTSPGGIVRLAAAGALPATTAITALLLIATVMDHSGEVTVLALGIAAAAPALAYVTASNAIGVLGVLLTSSSTASNVLFGPLQATTAAAERIPVELAVAAQVTGAAVGGALSPGDALMGVTVAGVPEGLGAVLRRLLPWTLATSALVAAATVALYFLG